MTRRGALGVAAGSVGLAGCTTRATTLRPDIAFLPPDRAERADLFLPDPMPAPPPPAVVVLHGGGWVGGDRVDEHGTGRLLASHGIPALVVGYWRGAPGGPPPWPRDLQDCLAAVLWLRREAASLGIDAQRVGAVGFSAGGHLATMLGVVSSPPAVSAVVAFYAPLTFQKDWAAFGPREAAPELYRALSPMRYPAPRPPPMLLVHGDADPVVDVEESRAFATYLNQLPNGCELIVPAGAGHGFPIAGPGLDLTDRVVDFLHRSLGRTGRATRWGNRAPG